MTHFTLRAHAEKLAPPDSYTETLQYPPLYHQIRTREALRETPVVINTYNTGTGKTLASLLRLFDLNGQGKRVLFIAPTNALITQHTEDIRQFVADYGLAYTVKAVNAPSITALREEIAQEKAINLRRGEVLYRLMRNPRELDADIPPGHALIMVTNPDIFYYLLYFRYDKHDQRNLATEMIRQFDYIVVDEFHYYSNKQLVAFLFAFALFDQFGYFDVTGRRVCLLSATPRPNVLRYIEGLFGDRYALIAPDNEPEESAAYTIISTLAPLEVNVQAATLTDWVEVAANDLLGWIRDGQDGALISGSLARINDAYALLRRRLDESQLGRITGPEPEAARQAATKRSLILATPTVDIGYNFAKQNKRDRQNVDFVVCDARFGDELVQRIGRAGRVLGKDRADIPARAVMLLSNDAATALADLDGQTLDRASFARVVGKADALPHKHQLEGYIRSYAIQEVFYPIYQLSRMMIEGGEGAQELEALYARLCQTFAPDFLRKKWQPEAYMRKYQKRDRWLRAVKDSPRNAPPGTEVHLADWLYWHDTEGSRPDPAGLRPLVGRQWRNRQQRREIIAFVESQHALSEAQFSFRDAFQGPTVAIYDPRHVFSSQTVNTADLFHLLSNYRLSEPLTPQQFQHETGYAGDIPQADFNCLLKERHETGRSVEFVYNTSLDRQTFNDRWVGLPVALTGLRLQVREYGGDPVEGGVHHAFMTHFQKQPVVLLIVPPELGYVRNKFNGTELWSRRLTVNFPDGTQADGYQVFAGTSAFEAHAELKRDFFAWQNRQREDAIIL